MYADDIDRFDVLLIMITVLYQEQLQPRRKDKPKTEPKQRIIIATLLRKKKVKWIQYWILLNREWFFFVKERETFSTQLYNSSGS